VPGADEPQPVVVRTELVPPPSAARETALVLKILFQVLLWSAIVVFGHPDRGAEASVLPFERRFQDLGPGEQRIFRLLQEGVLEAEAIRSRSGAWPGVEQLAAEGVPPFTADPLDRGGYTWRLLVKERMANYLGTPRVGTGLKSFLVILSEPETNAVDALTPVDEQHHRLDSGMLIHVGFWIGPGLDDPTRPVDYANPDDGWMRVVTGASRP
jgi:hypothetical protein